MMKRWSGALKGAIAAATIVVAATAAYAMSVQPVVIDLKTSGRQMSQVVSVENSFQTPLPVELRVQDATWGDAGLVGTGKDSGDLLVFPPQAVIAPGRTQSFRIQYVGNPDIPESKHYLVTVAQLPVELPQGQSAVQILYNFQVVTSVAVPGAKPAIKVAKAEAIMQPDQKAHLVLDLQNDATTYGYLSGGSFRIVQRDASGKEVFRRSLTSDQVQQEIGFGMVGAKHQRHLITPIILPQAGGTVEADFSPSNG